MSFGFITWFFIGLAIYLVGLGIFSFIKFLRNRKKVKNEEEAYRKELEENVEDKKQD